MRRVLRTLQAAVADQAECQERLMLLNQPWLEDYLHWVVIDGEKVLHGKFPPPKGRARSVTRNGWCLGQRGRTLHP